MTAFCGSARAACLILGILTGCAGPSVPLVPATPDPAVAPQHPSAPQTAPASVPPATAAPPLLSTHPQSNWIAVPWSDLPGWGSGDDTLYTSWTAWLRGCRKPVPAWAALCTDLRALSIADAATQRAWIEQNLQPYRIESLDGRSEGLLTGYFEPVLAARRLPNTQFTVPLYQPPPGLTSRRPWFTREEIESRTDVQAQMRDRAIAYLADPLDALLLHIQGSGRVRIVEADGRSTSVRLAYAGSNEQPYRSIGRWLQDQGALRDTSWPAIRSWAAQNPQRLQAMLWSNPRYVFFREQTLNEAQDEGPIGSAGVPLTGGTSIAVDPASIPLGTPVWMVSAGPVLSLQRLVLAQDQGSAISGAVRADLYVGSGESAGDMAGRLRQGLRLWALWPRR